MTSKKRLIFSYGILALLLAVLASSGQMEEPPADAAFLGELALDGSLRPVSGVLPMALAAAADGIRSLYVPAENAAEAAEACATAARTRRTKAITRRSGLRRRVEARPIEVIEAVHIHTSRQH